jgi:hypothetical protein
MCEHEGAYDLLHLFVFFSADIEETLTAMRARARQAVEALSAFSCVSKGHSALTIESGSLIEEVRTF